MVQQLVDKRDMDFVLWEQLECERFLTHEKYKEFNRKTCEMILTEAKALAVKEILPTLAEGDVQGVRFENGTVKVPDCFRPVHKKILEGDWQSMVVDSDMGGQGVPGFIAYACAEHFHAANYSLMGYAWMGTGTAKMIHLYGTDEQKQTYIPHIIAGKWGGTMLLTESGAGSDVGALETTAIQNEDGSYSLSGNKIFITNGEHDLCDNIIHPVLARIEGDPPGTTGISIFIVPKFLVNPDGSLGERKDLICSGIEHKMGLKGNATSTLNFGDNGKCIGYLMGEERQGMKVMFQLMNEARIFTGIQAQSVSSAAYMHAVTYARNRIQGAHITQMLNPAAPKVPIIEHPDVKRMLLYMKSTVEGMRMLTLFLAYNRDITHSTSSAEESKEATAIVEILTPIVKAGISDAAWLVTAEAMQVFGGYGYCQEYPVEQYARDSKVFSIYEGTNAIQSLDLQMRKILMNPDMYNYSLLKKFMADTIEKARDIVDVKYIIPVVRGAEKLDEVIKMMQGQMQEGKFMALVLNATPLQQAMFPLVLAWLHLWSLTITTPKVKALFGQAKGEERQKIISENSEAAYYSGRMLSSQFYIGAEYPKFFGRMECILGNEGAALKVTSENFSGAPKE